MATKKKKKTKAKKKGTDAKKAAAALAAARTHCDECGRKLREMKCANTDCTIFGKLVS
jgi:hypothetical protein